MKQYKTVIRCDLRMLDEAVNELREQGWETSGNMTQQTFFDPIGNSSFKKEVLKFTQTMIKPEKTDKMDVNSKEFMDIVKAKAIELGYPDSMAFYAGYFECYNAQIS